MAIETRRPRDLQAQFLAVLASEQQRRGERPRVVTTVSGGVEMEWEREERHAMLRAVEKERRLAGLAPVSVADVHRAEVAASGHIDYSAKFALYCAELALDRDPQR